MADLILAFDAENATRKLLRDQEEFALVAADSQPQCLRLLYQERPKLVLMNVTGPRPVGIELCRLIRQMCDVPILCLTTAADEMLIAYLEAGADGCVTKPVGSRELEARLQALLRRVGNGAARSDRVISAGDIQVDMDGHLVTKGGKPVALTLREFKLLAALAERPNSVVSHDQLLAQAWGPEFVNDTHYLRLYIGYLRQKLEDDPRNPSYILTEWGIGYRLSTTARPDSRARVAAANG